MDISSSSGFGSFHDEKKLFELMDFDKVLESTGFGRYNYMILAVCGLGMLANGIQNGLSAYLLPSAICEFQISSSDMANANVAFMLGGIFSAYMWGMSADIIGKKYTLVITFLLDSAITVIGSAMKSYSVFTFIRGLNGFFIGSPGCLLFSYLADFTPKKMRSKFTCCLGFCFIMSWIVLPVLAMLILPKTEDSTLIMHRLGLTSWRLYLLIFSLPSFLSAILILKLPESPKYFYVKGQEKKCLVIFKKMYRTNTKQNDVEFNSNLIFNKKESSRENSMIIDNIKEVLNQTIFLFKIPNIFKTLNLMIIMFANMFGCYGFGLWIPELISQIYYIQNLHLNNSVPVCQWKNEKEYNLTTPFTVLANITGSCDNATDPQIYKDTVMIGVACLCYNLISVCLSQCVSPQNISTMSLIIAGIAAGIFISVSSPFTCLILIAIFQSATITGNIVIISVVMDTYPIEISSMAVCIVTLAGRLGAICSNLFFGLFINISCQYPILLVAILSIGGLLIKLVNKVEDIQKIKQNESNSTENCMKKLSDCDLNAMNTHI